MTPSASLLAEAERQKMARIDAALAALDLARKAPVLGPDASLHFNRNHPLFGQAQRTALALHRWRNPKHPDNYPHAHSTITFESRDDYWPGGWRVFVSYFNDVYSGGSCAYEFDVTGEKFFEEWRAAEGGSP